MVWVFWRWLLQLLLFSPCFGNFQLPFKSIEFALLDVTSGPAKKNIDGIRNNVLDVCINSDNIFCLLSVLSYVICCVHIGKSAIRARIGFQKHLINAYRVFTYRIWSDNGQGIWYKRANRNCCRGEEGKRNKISKIRNRLWHFDSICIKLKCDDKKAQNEIVTFFRRMEEPEPQG